ncbi:hypothetical protein C8R48DRAFT_671467 [Suillus tomentosus]|nr:hypothetical protein C8R48DRAFT_671467 [Suillus tomentosus]
MRIGTLEADPMEVNPDLNGKYPETFQEQDPMEVDTDLEETHPETFQEQDPMEVDTDLQETDPGTFQEQDPMEVDIDLEETHPEMFQEQDPMEVDIESNDANTVGASQSFLFGIHQAQGTHLMDGDASVNADIDMNEFYLENMESGEAMQIDADSGQIDID